MIPLMKLKKDVQFNGELTKVVDVLRGIAASRYFILERQLSLYEGFSQASQEVLSLLDLQGMKHPFAAPASETTAAVMITSDAGFLGGLNAQVVNMGLKQAGPKGPLTVIGERGAGILRDLRREFTPFPGIQDANGLALVGRIRDHLIKQSLSGACGRVVVIYPKSISFAVQRVTAETFLPVSEWPGADAAKVSPQQVIWESSPQAILEYLITQWMAHRLSALFATSRLAELAARAVHLEGSYQELGHVGKKLRLQYFRSRHEVIDRSMREIFATQLLYRKKEEDEKE